MSDNFEQETDIYPIIPREKLCEILDVNERSVYYNLSLSERDVAALAEEQGALLASSSRLEFGFETLESIINRFYKSPYVNQFEYVEIISEIQHLFYVLKNEVDEAFSDEELIELMSELFDGACNGSIELLKGLGAQYIIERANSKTSRKRKENQVDKGPYASVSASLNLDSGEIAVTYTEEQRAALAKNVTVMLKELSLRYTEGRSFSIKAEVAQGIICSIIYASSLAGEAELYRLNTLRNAYEKGLGEIDKLLELSKRLYDRLKKSRLNIMLVSYNTAIDLEIPVFLKNYDKIYRAAENPALSYFPVYCGGRLQGVSYMESYLRSMLIENEFCAHFDSGDIATLLAAAVSREWTPNVFALTLTNAVFAFLIGKPRGSIALAIVHRRLIERKLKNIAESGISLYTVIEDAARNIAENYENAATRAYVERYASEKLASALAAVGEKGVDLAVYFDNMDK